MPLAFDLSFRHERSGGDIDIALANQQAVALRGHAHLILLIHGYNNDAHDADQAYQSFCAREQLLVGAGRDWAPGAVLVRVYWPGDARWWIASPLYYPFAIPRALTIGQEIARILVELAQYAGDILTVDCVAHSLGNRVLLHCLTTLGLNPAIWIRRVVHMAAAVPVSTLETTASIELLRAGLLNECVNPARAVSLFSGHDTVLALAFPPGETVADTYGGGVPVALGHGHWDDGDQVINLTQLQAAGAQHSSYWGAEKGNSPELERWLRETINTNLDLSNAAARGTATALIASRGTAAARDMAGRSLDSRELPARDSAV
jgi:hypothetical protein